MHSLVAVVPMCLLILMGMNQSLCPGDSNRDLSINISFGLADVTFVL